VEFRAMSFGAGGGTNLIGTATVNNIDPGHHAFAYIDWNFSSALIHRCIMVRANCAGDPAAAFGTDMTLDDNQAQRNLDPLFAAPGLEEAKAAAQVIERTFLIQNGGRDEAVFGVFPAAGRIKSDLIRAVLPEKDNLQRIKLKPQERREVMVRFEIAPNARLGEKLHCPLEVRNMGTGRAAGGGVTFTIEVAAGRLEGRLVNRACMIPREGKVIIENTKQANLRYESKVGRNATFSFPKIVPGPYRIQAECGRLAGKGSVFVAPNSITTKVLLVEVRAEPVREPMKVKRAKAGTRGT
jgi:hypothetical protein